MSSQKSPIISGSFAKNDLQLKASYESSPPSTECTECQRPTGCLIFTGHFSQQNPIISGSFAENDLQLEASDESSPPCTHVFCTCAHCLRHFRQKSPIISGSFAENDLQLKASDESSPPCILICTGEKDCSTLLQCVAVCCSVLQCGAVFFGVL